MKLPIAILTGTLCLCCGLLAEQPGPDPYSIELVRTALKTQSEGILIAKVQTHLARMGDGVSIALLKILTEDDLTKPHSVESFLPIIREGFSQPQLITNATDRRPQVTLFLLVHIRSDVPDVRVQGAIEDTIQFVRQKTGL
jgi:hypothetical protein